MDAGWSIDVLEAWIRAEPGRTHAELDERFGPGEWTPSMPPHVPRHVIRYRVEDPPYAYVVTALFARETTDDRILDGYPSPDRVAVEVAVERERVYRDGEVAHDAVTIEVVDAWIARLCDTRPGTPAEALTALGFAGEAQPSGSYFRVEPTPAGTKDVQFFVDAEGVGSLEVALPDGPLRRADLDRRFGPGRALPRLHPFDDHKLSYRVEAAAAFGCTVFAVFAGEPTEASPVRRLTLRRERPSTVE